ncbi:MAG TPA: Imm42 family immunity protein [Acidobacteriaceae bacterium]|nr:Imm42 family immunity protein [Acidobacteriaceae bacterium]
MMIGDPATFAVESEFTEAYKELSLRALGFFVIHIQGRSYGVKSPDATLLANSFDEVCRRISGRGLHLADRVAASEAGEIAEKIYRALYVEHDDSEDFFGMNASSLSEKIHSAHLLWAPDGDQAFDDGSFILQFDAKNQVRLIAFTVRENFIIDPESLQEIWLGADDFYGMLQD